MTRQISVLNAGDLLLYLQASKGLFSFYDPFVRLLTLQIPLKNVSQYPNSSSIDG